MTTDKLSLKLNNLSNNLCLYYSLLVDDIYKELMDKALAAGHKGLKLSHALILPQISSDGTRIVDIAKSQGVSKQAIGQIANELENLGYITRTDDQTDKRSKKLILTAQGIQLIRQAAGFTLEADTELKKRIGEAAFDALKTHSHTLFKRLSLKYPDAGAYTPEIANELPLIAFATSVATQLDLFMQEQNAQKGHSPLKRSYWQVLEKISQQGVRINDLAELNGISKQAISQLANEIEKADYIARVDDPSDKRSRKLLLTDKGEKLILDTIASTAYVEALIEKKIGNAAIAELKQAFQQYLAHRNRYEKAQQPGTEEKAYNAIASFINNLSDNEKDSWLVPTEKTRSLSPYALDKIRQMQFKGNAG
jgi:DNA-binding MarR family transcriptional regulator